MFETVLIANRGEIACRIIRTLRRLGIRSVAVYSDADAGALHVRLADAAVRIGPAAAVLSYLDAGAIVSAARSSGADAIHPGYGFLSENSDFAGACADAGITFIGPPPRAIEIMGDKIRAKRHVAERGVPIIPGAGEAGDTDGDLVAAATGVGYPLLIKPSAGGGGKGMTVVTHPADLPSALAGARRVARAAFGDDALLLERYLAEPRHIEVQVLADDAGTVIHLGERECSLQRRHQKIIEEAPSPLLTAAARERMGAAACAVARSVDYRGAGTVEFLVSAAAPDDFYFMEMNTRLQVEHPVTEEITGIDLVEQQLRIAAGLPLGISQHEVVLTGHSIEARLYAEDPERDFLPSTGRVLALHEPAGVRVDSSLIEGLVVDANYDPMLAKIIATGSDRAEALSRLDVALASTVVLGVRTNLAFLRALLADEDVRAGRLDTGLIARRADDPTPPRPNDAALAAAALSDHAAAWVPGGPWAQPSGWRLGDARAAGYHFRAPDGETVRVSVSGPPGDALVAVGERPTLPARWMPFIDATAAVLEWNGGAHPVVSASDGPHRWIAVDGGTIDLYRLDRAERLADHRASLTRIAGIVSPDIRSVMPGTVVAIAAATGTTVETGQLLLTIEAMKMEHALLATTDGVVTIDVSEGDLVSLDQVVARITPTHSPHEGAAP